MKFVVLALTLLSFKAMSNDTRVYSKISSKEATVKIETENKDDVQAAVYVDAKENKQFIQDLLKDKNSQLFRLKMLIEKDNCGLSSPTGDDWIEGCGQVTITPETRTSFGRGGWSSGGASYTFFMGFTSIGTGHDFDVSYMVTFTERAEARLTKEGNYAGTIIKTYSLLKTKKLEDETP